MNTIAALLGLVLVLFVLLEAFEALVLPRRVLRPFRFTRLYYRATWGVWLSARLLMPTARSRQTFLSLFGPLSLLILFAIWAAALIVGFGLIYYYAVQRHKSGVLEEHRAEAAAGD